jgi:two-component system alkaline phosphatase synthesis response regulator PhoP
MKTILLVDDERQIAKIATDYLRHAGFGVIATGDGNDAVALARDRHPDLMVLDLGLPSLNGLEVAKRVRQQSSVPIIMLTARVEESDRLLGLELGADDYVVKPFSPRELVARVKAVLRRADTGSGSSEIIQRGDLTIDTVRMAVTRGRMAVELTATELQLLAAMARQPGRIFTRGQLLDAARGTEVESFERAIDAHIKNIRRKLEPDPRKPQYLLTVYGIGNYISSQSHERSPPRMARPPAVVARQRTVAAFLGQSAYVAPRANPLRPAHLLGRCVDAVPERGGSGFAAVELFGDYPRAGGAPIPLIAGIIILGVFLFEGSSPLSRRLAVPLGDLVRKPPTAWRTATSPPASPPGRVGSLQRVATAFNTMTSRLAAQEQQRRNLMADIAHELRTPLSVIQGRLEGLLDGIYPRDDQTIGEVIEETVAGAACGRSADARERGVRHPHATEGTDRSSGADSGSGAFVRRRCAEQTDLNSQRPAAGSAHHHDRSAAHPRGAGEPDLECGPLYTRGGQRCCCSTSGE